MSQELSATEPDVPATAREGARARRVIQPVTDIYETESHVVVVAELPGVAPGDVDVTLERGVLTVRGRARAEARAGVRPVYAEFAAAEYERAFALSETIDQDGVEAAHAEGVLTLRLPKAEPAKPKRITVQAG